MGGVGGVGDVENFYTIIVKCSHIRIAPGNGDAASAVKFGGGVVGDGAGVNRISGGRMHHVPASDGEAAGRSSSTETESVIGVIPEEVGVVLGEVAGRIHKEDGALGTRRNGRADGDASARRGDRNPAPARVLVFHRAGIVAEAVAGRAVRVAEVYIRRSIEADIARDVERVIGSRVADADIAVIFEY